MLSESENTEVLPPGPVAVAVIVSRGEAGWAGTNVKEAWPLRLVLTFISPIKVFPSSVPSRLLKNRMVKSQPIAVRPAVAT
jgi:hypothetical protein